MRYELHHSGKIEYGELEKLREDAKYLSGDWFICYHVLSSMDEIKHPIVTKLNVCQMEEMAHKFRKGVGIATLVKEYRVNHHKAVRIINSILSREHA